MKTISYEIPSGLSGVMDFSFIKPGKYVVDKKYLKGDWDIALIVEDSCRRSITIYAEYEGCRKLGLIDIISLLGVAGILDKDIKTIYHISKG